MRETRPWIGAHITVGRFILQKDVRLLDFTRDAVGKKLHRSDADPRTWEPDVWTSVNRAFSEPVTGEDRADYAPTQYLAEAFREAGYDGVCYGSMVGKGKTVAISDLNAAELAGCILFEVTRYGVDFSSARDEYKTQYGQSLVSSESQK